MIINMQSGGVVPERIIDAQTITPGTADQAIAAGTYLRGALTILGDADLIPSKIPSDINLFGVQGTRQADNGSNVWERGYYTPQKNYGIKFDVISDSTYQSSHKVQVTPTGMTTQEVTPEMFVGKKLRVYNLNPNSYQEFTSTTEISHYSNGELSDTYNYTYNPETGIITINEQIYDYTLEQWKWQNYNWSVAEIWELKDYIVNDNANAYPDKDYGDGGYYYKLLAQVTSPNAMSLSANALETVQQDYRDTIETEVSNANA